jgi:hypothetical protein
MSSRFFALFLVGACSGIGSCNTTPKSTVVNPEPIAVSTPGVDPDVANTIGFFLDDWTPKTFAPPAYIDTVVPAMGATTINIDAADIITKIPSTIYGNNAVPYMTQIVSEPVLLNHIKNLQPHIIRFPGGSLSDVYFWNATKDTMPTDVPGRLPDKNGIEVPIHYLPGKNNDSVTLSVDNYYRLLQQTGCQGIITINYGYARYGTSANPVAQAAHLAADWVRYDNGRTKYWEIGNESNGDWETGYRIDESQNKGGQPTIISGDLYGEHFKVFSDSMKKAAASLGKTIHIGAVLLEKEPAYYAPADLKWNKGVLSKAGAVADYYIIHSYFTPWKENTKADVILSSGVYGPRNMMNFVKAEEANNHVPVKPLALTEWNISAIGSMQMVSHINGLHADLVLGELLKNKYGLAARWNFANGWDGGNDHGMFNIGNEPFPLIMTARATTWNPRPVFYHMYYFQKMMGDRLVNSTVTGSTDISAYASTFNNAQVAAAIINRGTTLQTTSLKFTNYIPGTKFYWYTLTGGNDNGEFSRKVFVNGQGPSGLSGGPADSYTTLKAFAANTKSGINISIPARSAVFVVIDKKE